MDYLNIKKRFVVEVIWLIKGYFYNYSSVMAALFSL